MKNELVPMSQTVCAVVVTFNRLALLKLCLDGVRAQSRLPDRILVVDNGSTDGTSEWLATQADLTVIRQENLGSSGGQYAGVKSGYEAGYDWVWFMDDDILPFPEALETQLNVAQPDHAAISLRQTIDGKLQPMNSVFDPRLGAKFPPKETGGKVVERNYGHFEGMLVSRRVIEKAGCPDPRFFVVFDDVIYGYLVSKVARIFLPPDPLFRKLLPEPGGAPSLLNIYYYTRNFWLLAEYLEKDKSLSRIAYLNYFSACGKRILRSLLLKDRWLRIRLILSGLKDGLAGNWGAGNFFVLVQKNTSRKG